MKKHRNVLNLSVWVLPELKKQWDKQRLKESRNPEKPLSWSEWLHTKVSMALNIDQMPPDNGDNNNAYSLKAILHNKQIEIERLNKTILELQNKEIGVSDDRILRILRNDTFLSFDEIVQELINTESDNTFKTLQKLALSEIIESDNTGNKWRLKP
jgi:hypothetical protein